MSSEVESHDENKGEDLGKTVKRFPPKKSKNN